MGGICGWIWADVGNDSWTGVIEVACVMATVGIHIIKVALGTDMWVKELKVSKCL